MSSAERGLAGGDGQSDPEELWERNHARWLDRVADRRIYSHSPMTSWVNVANEVAKAGLEWQEHLGWPKVVQSYKTSLEERRREDWGLMSPQIEALPKAWASDEQRVKGVQALRRSFQRLDANNRFEPWMADPHKVSHMRERPGPAPQLAQEDREKDRQEMLLISHRIDELVLKWEKENQPTRERTEDVENLCRSLLGMEEKTRLPDERQPGSDAEQPAASSSPGLQQAPEQQAPKRNPGKTAPKKVTFDDVVKVLDSNYAETEKQGAPHVEQPLTPSGQPLTPSEQSLLSSAALAVRKRRERVAAVEEELTRSRSAEGKEEEQDGMSL
jgi:hypothetical protein